MRLNQARIRQDTPGCSNLIHFNNAGASLQPSPVADAVLNHLLLEQQHGGYEAAEMQASLSERFYHICAQLLNCAPGEIAFAENSTRAWSQLLLSIVFEAGDRILTGQSEYASNYLTLMHLSRHRGVRIDVVPNREDGQICLHTLEQKLDNDVRLIALTHVASQSGVIQPAAEVGRLARRHRILYLLDACQSAGQLQLDVNAIGCDMLTASGRKYMRGPRGTGFMYVRRHILDYLQPPSIDLQAAQWTAPDKYELRDDARRFEVWEHYVAGKIGLAAAADYALTVGMDVIETNVRSLAQRLRRQLSAIPHITVHESGTELSGIVTFSHHDYSAAHMHQYLRSRTINTSIIRRQNNQLDFTERHLGDINRASVHYYNTVEEVDQFCDSVSSIR